MTQDADINGGYGTGGGMDAPVSVVAARRWVDDLDRCSLEIRAAAKVTQAIMRRSKIRHDRAGNAFRDGWPEHPDDLNNYPFKFTNSFTPSLAYNAPRIRIQSRKSMALKPILDAVTLAVNAWSTDANVQKVLRNVAYDLCFDFGVVCLGLEEYEDKHGTSALKMAGELPLDAPNTADRIYASSVLPNRFIMDPKCTDPDDCLWAGHFEIVDKNEFADDLMADGADPVMVEQVRNMGGGTAEKLKRDVNVDPMTGEGLQQDEIVVLHVWHRKDKLQYCFGFTGDPYTSTPLLLDEPQPYVGPENGPYVVFGVYQLRGQAFPYAPLAPTDAPLDESNAHRAQMRDDARGAKNVMAVRNPQDAQAMNAAASNSAVPLSDLSDKPVFPVVMGGLNETNLQASQMLDGELDAITGISQAAQGQLGASNSATEVAESSQRMNSRIENVQVQFRTRVIEMYRRVVDHFLSAPLVRQFVKLVVDGVEQDAMVVGGPDADGTDLDTDDLGIEIVPYSMEYVGSAELRQMSQEMFQNTIALVQAVEAWPVGVNWKEIGDRMFDAMNQPEGTKGLIDFAAVAQNAQMKMMAMAAAGASGGGPEVAVGSGGGNPGQKPAPNVTQTVRSGASKKAAQTRKAEGKA